MAVSIRYSSEAWKLLSGVISVYKPSGMHVSVLKTMIKKSIVNDLNRMERRVDPKFLAMYNRNLILPHSSEQDSDNFRNLLSSSEHQVSQFDHVARLEATSKLSLDEGQTSVPKRIALKEMKNDFGNSPHSLPEITSAEERSKAIGFTSNVMSEQSESEESSSLIETDYSSHPLVLGDPYEESDLSLFPVNNVTMRSSGVVVFGINSSSIGLIKRIQSSKPLITYQLWCELGKATGTGFSDSKTIARATWGHLGKRRWKLDQILSNIQASHQKMAWNVVNVDIQSQAAYELAVKGPIKPDLITDTIIYNLRCKEWNPPEFMLEVDCLGGSHKFLLDLVSEIAIKCKTFAHTKKMRVSQIGLFAAADCLVPQEFSLESILTNISDNRKLMNLYPEMLRKNKNICVVDYNRSPIEANDLQSPSDHPMNDHLTQNVDNLRDSDSEDHSFTNRSR